jgi:hypothetical protein
MPGMLATEHAHVNQEKGAFMRFISLVVISAMSIALGACLPIPQIVPERLTPRYLGVEAVSVNMNCANTNEFMFIEGPDSVRLRVSPKYFPESRLAVLQMTLVALGPRLALVESQNVAVVPVEGGPARSAHIVSTMSALGKTHDFEMRIENLPPGPIRVGLPVIKIGADSWRPADLELLPTGATLRPMPFNC